MQQLNATGHQPTNQATNFINLLINRPGIRHQLNTIFAYHYDAIQRECQQTISNLPQADQATIMDMLTAYMEDSMLWPDNNPDTLPEQLTK